MSEIRQNPITKDWVIIASERAKRPDDFKELPSHTHLCEYRVDCPFCPGNEKMTPEAILVFPGSLVEGCSSEWSLRVVENKYPALFPQGMIHRKRTGPFYVHMDGYGRHEVIIENPKHNATIGTLPDAQVELIIRAWRARFRELSKNKGVRLITLFRNHGPKAGTSLEHPHTQIIATPVLSSLIRQRMEEATRHLDTYGTCLFCDLLQEEKRMGDRIVMESDYFVVFVPFAPQTSYELWIIPKIHQPSFGLIDDPELADLARTMNQTLGVLYRRLNDPDYNLTLNTPPVQEARQECCHWHIRILPRRGTYSGFELGSGIYINMIYPQEAARFLREGINQGF
jgi:UDPglucose--hexose-1-phosphate uridylyltransferase